MKVDDRHPSHYAESCSIECLDAMLISFGYRYFIMYCIITAYKHLWRHKAKDSEASNFKKGFHYLDIAETYLLSYEQNDPHFAEEARYNIKLVRDTLAMYQAGPSKANVGSNLIPKEDAQDVEMDFPMKMLTDPLTQHTRLIPDTAKMSYAQHEQYMQIQRENDKKIQRYLMKQEQSVTDKEQHENEG